MGPYTIPAAEDAGRNLPAPNGASVPAAISFAHFLWLLKRCAWKMAGFVTIVVVATAIYSQRLTPVYESSVTITVDRQIPTGVIGQDDSRGGADSEQYLSTQVKLLQSDSVIRPVAERYHLMERNPAGQTGETPVALSGLKVTRVTGTFLLSVTYSSSDRLMAAAIANAVAKSYRDYVYETRYRAAAELSAFMEKQIEELHAKTESSGEKLAAFEQDLGMVNPDQKGTAVSARMIQLNNEFTTAAVERVKKEAALRSVQAGTLESLQVSSQGSAIVGTVEKLTEARQRLADLQTRLDVNHPEYQKAVFQVADLEKQLEAARKNIENRVSAEYREAVDREAMLGKEYLETKAEFDLSNARTFQFTALQRDADADRSIYEELVRKIKEAGINAGYQNNAINISDPARPSLSPVYPDVASNVLKALLFSVLFALAAAILNDYLDNAIRDPEQVRTLLGIDVIGGLPLVRSWKGKLSLVDVGDPEDSMAVTTSRTDLRDSCGFGEAVQSLRNSIVLSALDRPLKSLMLCSASPLEGRTTVAVQLAVAHARQKHRTLLIDGDLRRPGIHGKLGVTPRSGLGAALLHGLAWRDKLVHFEDVPDLDLLPAGPHSRLGADLIGANLKQILADARGEYDLVIVDAPPILGFPEPLQMAAAVDGLVLVALAGATNRKAIQVALNAFRRVHTNVLGLVLNQLTTATSDGFYQHGYYGKYAKHYSLEEGY